MTLDERIYNKALSDGMPTILATFIVAQARHETGNYTSNVFNTCNNAFGYKWVGQSNASPCTGSPEGNSYAKYVSLEDSVHELTLWIKRRQKESKFPASLTAITTPDQYAALLKESGYYGASLQTYLNGLLAALSKLGQLAVSPTGGAVLLVLVAIGIIIWRKRIFP